ncbi:MAG: YopX family protein [Intestinibacter bartlettii]
MREIKLRAWDIEANDWAYGTLNIKRFRFDIKCDIYGQLVEGYGIDGLIKEETMSEYTNCYDVNGKEIYEGDIVESQRGQNVYIGEVVWFDVGWYIHTELTNIKKDGSKYKYPDYIRLKPRYSTCINKVIGNKFENSELLKDK